MVDTKRYGSRAWIEDQYAAAEDDPWGLDWRPSQRYRYRRMLDVLQSVLAAHLRPLEIVDVGCATGAFTAMLGGLNGNGGGAALVGVDIAESAVARAAVRFPNIRFERMALDECARAFESKVDIVTCMEVLYYLPDGQRADAVRHLKSMLKSGGYLLVSSMIAPAPYFSFDQLRALLADELNVVATGVLYLKPLVLLEKLLMKLGGSAARNLLSIDHDRVGRWNRYAEHLLADMAKSHAYVIARNS